MNVDPMNVQIFGTSKSQDTKKALRFFKERGYRPHFVDLSQRPMAPGEFGRFVRRFGLSALIDQEGKAYRRQGLQYMRVPDEAMMQKLLDDPSLMVQPLVRVDNKLSVGLAEENWLEWCDVQKRQAK
jgi:arsenate reductase-like glutaredoxin family protein